MPNQKFSIGQAVSFGWEVAKRNFWFFLGLQLITLLMTGVPNYLSKSLKKEEFSLTAVIFDLIAIVLGIIVQMGWIKITLKLCDNQPARYSEFFSSLQLFFKYLFADIIYSLTVGIGTLALIVPGIILAIRLQFFPFFIVEKEMGAIESLEKSFAITKGMTLQLFIFGLLLMLLIVLGAIALGVGLLFAVPTAAMAAAFVYRKLSSQTNV